MLGWTWKARLAQVCAEYEAMYRENPDEAVKFFTRFLEDCEQARLNGEETYGIGFQWRQFTGTGKVEEAR